MRLPESLHPLLPADVDPGAVSDCVVLRTDSTETLLLRLPTGPRVLSRSKPTAKFETTSEARDLRLEEGALRITAASGERSIALASWLDRELVRDFLALPIVPVGRVSVPAPAATRVAPTTSTTVAAPPPPVATPAPAPAPLTSSGPLRLTLKLTGGRSQNPIMAIKAVREMTGVGLKEAKDLVEGGGSATIIGGPSLAQQINELDRAGCPYEVIPG